MTNISNPAISVEALGVAYGDHPVIENISMKFPKNQITALIGASGSGKSRSSVALIG